MNNNKTSSRARNNGLKMSSELSQTKSKLTPTNDIIFKELFGQKKNENILKDFLEAILDEKIEKIDVDRDTQLLPQKYNEKLGILDISATLDDGVRINIEMQNTNYYNIEKRITFYISKIYTKQLKRKGKYEELKKTIAIAILNFDYFLDIKDYHTTWKMTYTKDVSRTLNEQEIHFIELPKFIKSIKDKSEIEKSKLAQWLVFLDNSRREWIEVAKENNTYVRDANAQYEYLTGDEERERIEYLKEKYEHDMSNLIWHKYKEGEAKGEARGEKRGIKIGEIRGRVQGKLEGRAEGKAEGRLQGKAESKREFAIKMLKANIDINQIMEITGYTKEELEELRKEIKS